MKLFTLKLFSFWYMFYFRVIITYCGLSLSQFSSQIFKLSMVLFCFVLFFRLKFFVCFGRFVVNGFVCFASWIDLFLDHHFGLPYDADSSDGNLVEVE